MADERMPVPARDIVDLRRQGVEESSTTFNDRILRANMSVSRPDENGPGDKHVPVALYTRFSSSKQKQVSIARQIQVVTAYMRVAGHTRYALYSDPARSGRSIKGREDLARLLGDCRAGVIRDIMVEDFDRWSRETYDAVELCEELNDRGVAFHSAGDGRPLSKKEVIEAALKAERDRDRRALIMTAGRLQHALAGGAHSGTFFGYRYGEERGFLVQHPEEAGTILSIFEMAAAGMSYRAIARVLTERGDLNPSKGREWTRSSVSCLLRQEQYTGRVIYNRHKHTFNRKTAKVTTTPRHHSEVVIVFRKELQIVPDELFLRVHEGRRRRTSKRRHKHFLTGKLHCDCPGMAGNTFTMSSRQLHCKSWDSRSACGGVRHSVMLPVIERGVMQAVVGRLRSSVGSEAFAASVERSLREAADKRRVERARTLAEIDDVRVQLDKLLDEELRSKHRRDTLDRREDKLNADMAELEAKLGTLVPLPVVLDAEERLACLTETLERLRDRAPFFAETDSEAKVSNALARLVPRVDVLRAGRGPGQMRLGVHFDVATFLNAEDGRHPDAGQTEVIFVDVEQPMGRRARLHDVARRIADEGGHRIDDARWALVADRLPDVVGHRADCRGMSMRDVVDALMLRLRTGLPVTTPALGDGIAMLRALTRFVYAAGDQILLDTLAAADPDFAAGLDLRTIEVARSRWKVGGEDWTLRRGPAARLHLLDGRTALTDAQWAVSEPLIHYSVERSFKGTTGIPPRLLLEGVLLALKSGAGWLGMPRRFGEGSRLRNSARRLVRSGSWDRLVEAWGRACPELLENLDTRRLDNWLRGSTQWRGPAPRRPLHVRNGGVGVAARRPRRGSSARRGKRAAGA